MSDMKPRIRFQGFDVPWEQRKLGDVVDFLDERRKPLESGLRKTGPYPYYGASGIIDYVNDYLFDEELILLSEDGANIIDRNYRVCFMARGKYWVNNHAHVLKAKENYFNEFICEALERLDYTKYNTGTAQPKLNQEVCRNINILTPNIEEQVKISSFFTKLDNLITLHQRELSKLKQYKQAMLKKMFPKEGEMVPEIRFVGFTDPWEQRKLGEVANFSKGRGYSKNDLTEEGTPIILYGSLYTNYQTVINEVNTFTVDKVNSVYSLGNEVVVPSSGESAEDIARASAIANKGIILGGDLNIIHSNSNIDPIFLALLISNGERKIELAKKAQGKSVVHLYNKDLEEVNLIYPTKEEQTRISNFFSSIDNLITLHQRKLEKLENMKKACLDKMFI